MTNPHVGNVAAAVAESQRVESGLAALGYDRLAIYGVQQEIADLCGTTTLSWKEATDRIMDRILSGRSPESDR